MQKIINSSGLQWEGWNVVHYEESPEGFTDKNGAFVNGKWQIKKTFQLTDDGVWDIPDKLVGRENVQI